MLKLKETNIDESISIKDMRVGQIGIITEWKNGEFYLKTLIKRIHNGLISLTSDCYWEEDVFYSKDIENLRVKILPNGTELIICNNE